MQAITSRTDECPGVIPQCGNSICTKKHPFLLPIYESTVCIPLLIWVQDKIIFVSPLLNHFESTGILLFLTDCCLLSSISMRMQAETRHWIRGQVKKYGRYLTGNLRREKALFNQLKKELLMVSTITDCLQKDIMRERGFIYAKGFSMVPITYNHH